MGINGKVSLVHKSILYVEFTKGMKTDTAIVLYEDVLPKFEVSITAMDFLDVNGVCLKINDSEHKGILIQNNVKLESLYPMDLRSKLARVSVAKLIFNGQEIKGYLHEIIDIV